MNFEPRQRDDYSPRQIEAAHRVLMDLGQVLASFRDCLVIVGGWVPQLLLGDAEPKHEGSIDVDIALDAGKLNDGRYAELVKLLLNTKRYRRGGKDFQLVVTVDLADGEMPIEVEVDFLAAKQVKMKKRRTKLVENFRVLQADACGAAFQDPVEMPLKGTAVRGETNTVRLRVASIPDFLVMKAHAIGGREKPKDVYDLCYCLEKFPGGMQAVANIWKLRYENGEVRRAVEILREKFSSVGAFGPRQLMAFNASSDSDSQAMDARRAYEVVQAFLKLVGG